MAFGAISCVMCSAMPLIMIHEKAHDFDPGRFQNYKFNGMYFTKGGSIKKIATAIAHLGQVRHALYKGGSGDFYGSKWDFAHYSQDFNSLKAFAKKVEVTL